MMALLVRVYCLHVFTVLNTHAAAEVIACWQNVIS